MANVSQIIVIRLYCDYLSVKNRHNGAEHLGYEFNTRGLLYMNNL